jgi:hypothetical protein
MLNDVELREKVQYRRLMELAKLPGTKIGLDMRVHRYKAVRQGKVMGYYSSLELACDTVDGVVTPPKVEFMWSESGVAYSRNYVLDTQRGVYYTRKLKNPYPNGLKVVGATGAAETAPETATETAA